MIRSAETSLGCIKNESVCGGISAGEGEVPRAGEDTKKQLAFVGY